MSEGNETKEFKAFFARGLNYLEGGGESSLRRTNSTAFKPYMIMIKGKTKIVPEHVEISWKSMDHSCCFVLDAGQTIYTWYGKNSNLFEKARAHEIARSINDVERLKRSQLVLIEDGEPEPGFWKLLGAEDGNPPALPAGVRGSDAEWEKHQDISLFRITNHTGKVEVQTLVKDVRRLKRSLVDDRSTFVIKAKNFVWIYVGKLSSGEERNIAKPLAQKFLQSLPIWARGNTRRVVQNSEPVLYQELFLDWNQTRLDVFEKKRQESVKNKIAARRIATPANELAAVMMSGHKEPAKEEEVFPAGFDTGNSACNVKIYQVTPTGKRLLSSDQFGFFNESHSYIVVVILMDGTVMNMAAYFWAGKRCTTEDKDYLYFKLGFMPQMLKALEEKGGKPPRVFRIRQGKEPLHFMDVLHGEMVITTSENPDENALFHVKGRGNKLLTLAVQVPIAASRLNSGDSFVLQHIDSNAIYVWLGNGCNKAEAELGTNLPGILDPDCENVVTIIEGEETDAFWAAIGGKAPYPSTEAMIAGTEAKFFQLRKAAGLVEVEQLVEYSEADLLPTACAIVDWGHDIYVWSGADANISIAGAIAAEYLKLTGRAGTAEVVDVTEGAEPAEFKAAFLAWEERPPRKEWVDPRVGYYAKIEEHLRQELIKEREEKARREAEERHRKILEQEGRTDEAKPAVEHAPAAASNAGGAPASGPVPAGHSTDFLFISSFVTHRVWHAPFGPHSAPHEAATEAPADSVGQPAVPVVEAAAASSHSHVRFSSSLRSHYVQLYHDSVEEEHTPVGTFVVVPQKAEEAQPAEEQQEPQEPQETHESPEVEASQAQDEADQTTEQPSGDEPTEQVDQQQAEEGREGGEGGEEETPAEPEADAESAAAAFEGESLDGGDESVDEGDEPTGGAGEGPAEGQGEGGQPAAKTKEKKKRGTHGHGKKKHPAKKK